MKKRGKFSLSNYKLLSCDMGELIPCGIYEVLPGDTVQHATNLFMRCSPLVTPPMHPVHARIHHWFVPYRLVWDDFEKFITGGPDGMDASVFPTKTVSTPSVGGLLDYLGIPPGSYASGLEYSALPIRAYQMIWNEWYRDQDLQSEAALVKTSGPDATTVTTLQNCAWEKDYFTSARPWEQKGPSITVPIGGDAPVHGMAPVEGIGIRGTVTAPNTTDIPNVRETDRTATYLQGIAADTPWNTNNSYVMDTTGSLGTDVKPNIWANADGTNADLVADLSAATGLNVVQFREAIALQRFEEARARFGSRYVEYLRYLGVRSSDARLQRPEYLGGGKQVIQFSEVLQTAEGTNPVGTMAGHGIGALRSNRFRRFFEEHGVVISLLSVKPRTMYADGLPRMWNRRIKEDFWQEELQHIGQQEVLNKEVYANAASPGGVFGYQDRYDEYRRTESTIAGEFRTVLDDWHFARLFTSEPALNADFVKCVPAERPFAVPANDVLLCMANHSVQARRLVSQTGSSFTF